MSKKNKRSTDMPLPEDQGLGDAVSMPEAKGDVLVKDVALTAPVAEPVPEVYDLTAHPDFVLQPGVGQRVYYRGERVDLRRLRKSQFIRLTTNPDASIIVRRK